MMLRTSFACGLLVASVLVLPPGAVASENTDYRVGVLDPQSGAREPAFARALVERVRAYVQVQPGFLLCEVRGSLDELARIAACDASERSCLRTLAERLNVDGLIFGAIEEDADGPVAVFQRYDAGADRIVFSARASFRAPTTKPERLDPEVRRMLLTLLDNASSAVALTHRGASQSEVPPIQPAPARTSPVVAAEAESGSSAALIAGYALLGAAAVSVGLTVASSLQVVDADDRPEYLRYREAVGARQPDIEDVCEEAAAGRAYGVSAADLREARDSCDKGTLFEVLQLVFLGSAVVTGGLGTYFLLSAGEDDPREVARATALRVAPRVSAQRVGLDAEVRF